MNEKSFPAMPRLDESESAYIKGSQIPSGNYGIKLAAPVYAKKQKRNRMAKKSRAINRKK